MNDTKDILKMHRYYTLILLATLTTSTLRAEDMPGVRKYFETHCVSCHGPDVAERKFRLDTLPAKLDDADTFQLWVKAYDKIARGEMPPKGKPQPKAEETKAVVEALKNTLRETSLAKQKSEGRSMIRRLNRVEYQTTLSDILGVPFHVGDQLPDDSIVAGFDNVGRGLDISPDHLLRYQDVAEKVVNSVIPNRPPTPIHSKRTGKQVTEVMSPFKDLLDKYVRFDGDKLVLHVRPYGHIPCGTAAVPQAGTYKVRASVTAINIDKPMPIMLSARDQYGREDNDIRGIHDAQPGKPLMIEGEFHLNARQVIVFTGLSLPDIREFSNKKIPGPLKDYKGPALVVDWVEISGPLETFPLQGYNAFFEGVPLKAQSVARAEAAGQKPPDISKRGPDGWIYDPMVMAPNQPKADAERLIRRFLPTAFRRPATKELEAHYVKIVHDALDRKEPFREAMIRGYKAILCSPHFLYLNQTKFDDYALASRMSYFLWTSMPDKELYDLAAKKELAKPEVLKAQVERMLKDPRAVRFRDNFAGQWLDLRSINATSPDPQLYAEFDPFLYWSIQRETEKYFDEVLLHDRPLTEFVHSDWTMLNHRLAKHYGIQGVEGGEIRRVTVPKDSSRGGLLTQASILKVTADGTKTSPVLRGKWVLERIIGLPMEPPPPGTPGIEPDIRGATTIRQQLDKHRNIASCAGCHKHIDPPGFALESFDPIGGKRDFYRTNGAIRGKIVDLPNYPGRKIHKGPDVELGGQLPDGRKFAGIDEYKQLLMSDKDQLARNLAEKLVIYSTGAEIQFADREEIERLVAKCRDKNYGFRSLVHEVVASRLFGSK